MKKGKNFLKAGLFLALAIAGCAVLNSLSRPDWPTWNSKEVSEGIYSQPKNTVEVLALGNSTVVSGIVATELYEKYGICAWNMGKGAEPMMSSYSWLKEIYSYQSESLKTVLLDIAPLRYEVDSQFYESTMTGMHLSPAKCEAAKAYTDTLDDFLTALTPVLAYHSRWKELSADDFDPHNYEENSGTRGYSFLTKTLLDNKSIDEIRIPYYAEDKYIEPAQLDNEAVLYLKKIIEFCREKGINLALMKLPGTVSEWSPALHNAVKELADQHGIEFMDFNYSPYLDRMGYIEAVNSMEGNHLNYKGASKLTSYLGEFLIENGYATDVRGQEKYAFLEEDVAKFHRTIYKAELMQTTDPVDYIADVMSKEDYTLFIAVRDDAANALEEEQRIRLAELGLEKLSTLEMRDSYLAVIKNGKVLYEESDHMTNEELKALEKEGYVNDFETVEERIAEDLNNPKTDVRKRILTYTGILENGISYTIKSGGSKMGNCASCIIDGKEYAGNSRGLNLVVYDNRKEKVIDQVVYDTYASSKQVMRDTEAGLEKSLQEGKTESELKGKQKQLYQYKERCESVYKDKNYIKTLDETGLYKYIKNFCTEKYTIYISAKDDAADSLSDEARNAFAELGLKELSQLQFREPYLGVIKDGVVSYEQRGEYEGTIQKTGLNWNMTSGAQWSSIVVGGVERSKNRRGINIVVYNNELSRFINSSVFDTYEYPVAVN